MKHYHKKRLLKLADFLDKLPPQKFRFSIFAQEHGKPMLEALKAGETECGTVACAVGWMPAVFPRQIAWESYGEHGYKDVILKDENQSETYTRSFNTAEKFFGLTLQETYKLFDPIWSGLGSAATPDQVANSIREFVALKS